MAQGIFSARRIREFSLRIGPNCSSNPKLYTVTRWTNQLTTQTVKFSGKLFHSLSEPNCARKGESLSLTFILADWLKFTFVDWFRFTLPDWLVYGAVKFARKSRSISLHGADFNFKPNVTRHKRHKCLQTIELQEKWRSKHKKSYKKRERKLYKWNNTIQSANYRDIPLVQATNRDLFYKLSIKEMKSISFRLV